MKYYCPDSLDAFLELREKLRGKSVVVLAGGTDLMPRFERGTPLPDHLIDIKQLSQLNSIRVSDDQIEIGALTTIQALHDHAVIQREFTALHQAAHEFAGSQIRHRGTIGGNICNASPAGDLLPGLYAFGAMLELTGDQGQKTKNVADFILGPGRTTLADDELLTSIILPRSGLRSKFQKVGLRQSMAISVLSLAVVYDREMNTFNQLTIAAGAVAPTVVVLNEFTSAYLKNRSFKDSRHHIDEAIAPIDDIRATAAYRRTVLLNLVKDFLK